MLAGFSSLWHDHRAIAETLLTWPNQRQAEGVTLTYGNFKGKVQTAAKTSKWDLALRLPPEAFVRLHLQSSKALTPALVALPDVLLVRAAEMDAAMLRASFVCYGRNDFRPKPSVFFPGIAPALDKPLIDRHLETDVELLIELAACRQGDEQLGFLKQWIDMSPEAARRWKDCPRWRRPLLNGDREEATQIWKAFIHLKAQVQGLTDAPIDPRGLGLFYQQFAGLFFQGRPRWHLVFWAYGYMMANGEELGETLFPPWERP
jgi:hypothetical protein